MVFNFGRTGFLSAYNSQTGPSKITSSRRFILGGSREVDTPKAAQISIQDDKISKKTGRESFWYEPVSYYLYLEMSLSNTFEQPKSLQVRPGAVR